MYSAAISHSSMVAERPRLSMTGRSTLPAAMSSGKFCMLRAPIWRMSACSATSSTWPGSMTSVTMGRPGPLPGLGQEAHAVHAQALEAVGAGARLEGAAAQDGGAGLGHRIGRAQQLVPALDGAGAGHDRERATADGGVAHPDDGVLAGGSRARSA